MVETFLWYSRYAVWVGAIVLLIQSLTGRSVGVITLMAVLLLGLGFLSFLGALGWQGLADASPFGTDVSAHEPAEARTASTAEPVRPIPHRAHAKSAPAAVPAQPHGGTPAPVPPAPADAPRRIATLALTADNPLVGASCTSCKRLLKGGQVILRCPECGAVQHASCWTDSGFRCSVEDCRGRGSLDAPLEA